MGVSERSEGLAVGQTVAPADATSGAPPMPRAATHDFRPDLEGLRGVAVLLVVAYHAGLPVGGGFIGVDVFFVLSGFLITGLLVRERERSGRIDLIAFYGRRVRRILPAAAVVVAATICVAPFVISPLDMTRVAADGASSILSFANIRFAATDLDYFAASATPSPFRQFWSLAVEEQFYLLWPAILIVATWFWRPRIGAGIVVAGLLVASLVACFVVTGIAIPWAFYSLPTRAWELAAGGLLAIALPLLPRIPAAIAIAAGWLGAALLVLCVVTFGGLGDYPSWYAIVPTVATVAIIASGELARSPGRAMQVPPLRFAGRISYSLYLWHWPVLVLAALALGGPLPLPVALLLAGGAIVLATGSYYFVEQPYRRPGPGRSMGTTLRWAGVAIATVGVMTVGVGAFVTAASGIGESSQAAGSGPGGTEGSSDVASLDEAVVEQVDLGATGLAEGAASVLGGAGSVSGVSQGGPTPDESMTSGPLPSAAESPGPLPSASAVPSPAASASPSPSPSPRPSPQPSFVAEIAAPPTGEAAAGALPANVRPGIAAARDDAAPLMSSGCGADRAERTPKICVYGRKDAPHTVVLIGDSHAAQWFGALRILARDRDWRFIPLTKNACTFIDAPVVDPLSKRVYVECAAWIDAVMRIVPTLHPDLVVVGINRWIIPAAGAPVSMVEQGRAIGRLLADLPHPVILLSDTPFFGVDVPACLAANRSNIDACRAGPGAIDGYWIPREKAAARAGRATLVDMTRAICPSLPCSPVVDGTIVMRDEHHLTYTFSRQLASPLGAVLDAIGVGLLPDFHWAASPPGRDRGR
jgi:peptidoglycan/LPS O-acetylase OafA/YrhL